MYGHLTTPDAPRLIEAALADGKLSPLETKVVAEISAAIGVD